MKDKLTAEEIKSPGERRMEIMRKYIKTTAEDDGVNVFFQYHQAMIEYSTLQCKERDELIEKLVEKINECFEPRNIECDGGACMGCWKDCLHSALSDYNKFKQENK